MDKCVHTFIDFRFESPKPIKSLCEVRGANQVQLILKIFHCLAEVLEKSNSLGLSRTFAFLL